MKALSSRLSLLMEKIISPAQLEFVFHRSTTFNLRAVFSIFHRISRELPAVIVLLDAEKRFDSLEWSFLHAVHRKPGVPSGFFSLIDLLYEQPSARLTVNDSITDSIPDYEEYPSWQPAVIPTFHNSSGLVGLPSPYVSSSPWLSIQIWPPPHLSICG